MQLSADDRSRIHAAVTDAEARSHVHIAVSVVPTSDRYALYPVLWGAIAVLLAGAVMALGWPQLSLRELFVVQAVVFIMVSVALEWWPLRVRLAPRHVRARHAQALARREFAARILASTERKGGVLIFVSLGERYAEIIADRDTHARVGDETWNRILGDYTAAARQGRITEGILTAINACASASATSD